MSTNEPKPAGDGYIATSLARFDPGSAEGDRSVRLRMKPHGRRHTIDLAVEDRDPETGEWVERCAWVGTPQELQQAADRERDRAARMAD